MARGAILEVQALVKRRKNKHISRQMPDSHLIPYVLGVLGVCVGSSAAEAQEIATGDAAISVQDRPRPEFDPIPIRFGSFQLRPSGQARVSYDDNIYATQNDKVDDALVTLGAGISARSNWSRNYLSLVANGAITRGLSQNNENTETYDTDLSGRLDLGVDTQLTGNVGYSRAYEPRGSVNDTSLRGPRIAYNTLELSTQLQHNAGRLVLEAGGSYDLYRYAPFRSGNAAIAQGDRNYRTWSMSGRAGYAIGPGIAAFVEGSYNQATYPDETLPRNRSSDGYAVRGGVQFGLTRLIRGRAAIGYQNQRYDDPAFPSISGLDFRANLEWNPTQLITLSLDAQRTIQRSPIVGVAGIRQTTYSGRVDYEFRRNVILNARFDRNVNEFSGTPQQQNDVAGSIGAEWLINRNFRLTGQAGYQRTRSENILGRAFDRKRISISLRYTL